MEYTFKSLLSQNSGLTFFSRVEDFEKAGFKIKTPIQIKKW